MDYPTANPKLINPWVVALIHPGFLGFSFFFIMVPPNIPPPAPRNITTRRSHSQGRKCVGSSNRLQTEIPSISERTYRGTGAMYILEKVRITYQFLSLNLVSPSFSCISWGFIARKRERYGTCVYQSIKPFLGSGNKDKKTVQPYLQKSWDFLLFSSMFKSKRSKWKINFF
jgi:hypothetical protein